MLNIGELMYERARALFPINRSLTGNGVRETLSYIKKIIPELTVHQVPSGTQAFDWTVPKEWHIEEAYILDPSGNRICDFQTCNLHLMGYSVPVDSVMPLDELQKHLYSIPSLPDAIPYVTSYYKENWGFCLSHKQRQTLPKGDYKVVIKSSLFDGFLNYGEVIIPGKSEKEVLLSTYVCHPSMANNELSGPVVSTALAEAIKNMDNREYTYRILFLPETIGSIVYINKHLARLKQHLHAGFIVTCVGDERDYSYLSSRQEDSLADKVAMHTLKHHTKKYTKYNFLDRGSDERQFCSPGVNLPVCSIMRSKYGTFPEYHTSLDDLSLITPLGLKGAYDALLTAIKVIEFNWIYKVTSPCEPQLGKRGLYPNTSDMQQDYSDVRRMTNFLAYADGTRDLIDIAEKINESALSLIPIVEVLTSNGLVERIY
ncbi:DUF4910 domain-containing protein [Pseudoalteromonas sp. RB2-MNA-CIBAN-0110]|uniref:DUF4910 domain-containing protein n=1 Tax=Pseudoalteromonas sp. RB2-MNA-CIBAN-0110 TaxID=3140439 RepID=UPI00331B7D82